MANSESGEKLPPSSDQDSNKMQSASTENQPVQRQQGSDGSPQEACPQLVSSPGASTREKEPVPSRQDHKSHRRTRRSPVEALQTQQGEEQEIASKTLQIQSKRFYLDLKQNKRGRFIKIAEVGTGGRKSRLLLAMSTATEFRDLLTDFSDYYSQLAPASPDAELPENGVLKSKMISKDDRRYYIDLKENQRGRFLRVSQTLPRGGPRSQVAIPAQGMVEFRDALTDLLGEYGDGEAGAADGGGGDGTGGEHSTPLPSHSFRADNKIFYFDVGENNRGVFMRVSEVRAHFRMSITVPEHSWTKFRDILNEYLPESSRNYEGGDN